MSSDMNEAVGTVNWHEPIEAVHEDGRVVGVRIGEVINDSGYRAYAALDSAEYGWFVLNNGDIPGNVKWRIRNVAQPTSAPEVPAALVERMVALVKGAAAERAKFDNPGAWFSFSSELGDEARAIVAELMPVDGDLDEARKIADDFNPESDDVYYAALAAIRRGRELERGEG